MNYKSIHDKIILRARIRGDLIDVYYEKHHVIPRCMGGDNSRGNIVKVTPEEHYLIHLLLCKIYPDHKGLIYAAHNMSENFNNKHRNNKTYGWLKRKFSIAVGIENSLREISWETRIKMGKSKSGKKLTKEHCQNAVNGRKGIEYKPRSIESLKRNKGNRCDRNNSNAQLTDQQIKAIKTDLQWNLFTDAALGRKHKVSTSTIWNIRLNKRWKHITI